MELIPNDISANFGTAKGRCTLMEKYGDSKFPFYGSNEIGESVLVSISRYGITTHTFQENGWVRVNFYDADGQMEGESFEGRWKGSVLSDKPAEQEQPVSFDFGHTDKHSNLYYTATKFVDMDSIANCQAIRAELTLTCSNQTAAWGKAKCKDFPVSNETLRRQYDALIQHLTDSWSVNGKVSAQRLRHWIFANCEMDENSGLDHGHTFATTDIALFYMNFNMKTARNGALQKVAIQVDVFNRFYITEDPIGDALTPACVAAYPKMSNQEKDLTFAAEVCSIIMSNMGDGEGIKIRLRDAVKTLNMLAGR